MAKQHSADCAVQQDDPLRALGSAPGTYILLLHCARAATVDVGSLGGLRITPGWYLYVGSAFGPGGVRARCRRHLHGGRPHWHLDYLRPLCRLQEIWYSHDPRRREHQWAALLARRPSAHQPFPGFGASDCDCPTHLFRFARRPAFPKFRREARKRLDGHLALGQIQIEKADHTPRCCSPI